MKDLKYFKTKDFHSALRHFFKSLNIPVNYIAEEPARPKDILSRTFKENKDASQLMEDVYFLGMVDDAAFEGGTSLDYRKIETDYDGILIFGVTLHPRDNGLPPTRSQLAEITRAFNREFHYTPVVVVFRYANALAFANAERLPYKQEWREGEKAGKVSLLRDIDLDSTHRGHLDILKKLTISRSGKQAVNSFAELYSYWQTVFNVSLLNKKFYEELSNWYFWAIKEVIFPGEPTAEDVAKETGKMYDPKRQEELRHEHNAKNVIRLLTRFLFVWFIKEKKLIPLDLFNLGYVKDELVKDLSPYHQSGLFQSLNKQSHYYKAILQNLFFATLNQEMGKRDFRTDKQHMNVTNLLRYRSCFKNPQKFIDLVEDVVPFMNGGLFECLDKPHPTKTGPRGGDIIVYEDGFSDRDDNPLVVPDYLFFGLDEEVDLSRVIGIDNKKTKQAAVKGLINIFESYKFTIAENTPIEEDIALDPELLGKVFENLLASYNPETRTTARKQTGSFYTPREIVNYMVDESLIAYLKNAVTDWGMKDDELDAHLHKLLSFDPGNPFSGNTTLEKAIIKALDNCAILDPACGSGAFPMGILQKMVHVLQKLDPDNTHWKELQRSKALQETESAFHLVEKKEDREQKLIEINEAFDEQINDPDYARKLFLIENCIYGVDIQPIAAQISKLRFFISLVVDQKVDKSNEKNFGIRPLPNLETKFVAANTLRGIEKPKQHSIGNPEIKKLEEELKNVRHRIFLAKTPRTKRKLREEDQALRAKMGELLITDGWANKTAKQLAAWDPYDQNASSPFFDPEWMFGMKDGFDVVIGNPPYINANELKKRLGGEAYNSLKSGYVSSKGTIDIYILFFEYGLSILSKNGTLSYITPNRYLSASYGQALREHIFNNYYIRSLSDFSSVPVFEEVSTYPVVSVFSSGKPLGETIKVRKYDSSFNVLNKWTNNTSDLDLLEGKIWGFLLNSKIEIVKKIISQSEPLTQAGAINATSTAKEADDFHVLINEKNGKKLINTGIIDRYKTTWGNEKLTDKGVQYQYPRLNMNSTIISKNRISLYNSPKIILAKIALKAEAFYDKYGDFSSINTNCIHSFSPNYIPEYITCWLNSKLFHFVFECFFEGLKMAGGYLLFSSPNLRNLFIKDVSTDIQSKFIIFHWIIAFEQDPIKLSLFDSIADSLFFNLYFFDHMKEKQIDIIQFVEKDLADVMKGRDFEQLPDSEKETVINQLYARWTHPDSEVRNRIKLFAVRSPEILKPILESR